MVSSFHLVQTRVPVRESQLLTDMPVEVRISPRREKVWDIPLDPGQHSQITAGVHGLAFRVL